MYIPELIKKPVIVETELGEVIGTIVHLSNFIVLTNRNKDMNITIIRSWQTIKWLPSEKIFPPRQDKKRLR